MSWASEVDAYLRTNDTGDRMIQLPIDFLTINEEGFIWSMPVELFTEIAQTIRKESPYTQTFFFGYCNGLLGYLPTGRAGMSLPAAPLLNRRSQNVIQAVLALLNERQR